MKDRRSWFFEARVSSTESASCSDQEVAIFSGSLERMAAGTVWSMSSSSEPTPTVFSIPCSSFSSGPMCRSAKHSWYFQFKDMISTRSAGETKGRV